MSYPIVDTFPQLETERLVLRRLVPADAAAVLRIFGDHRVTRFYDLETLADEQEALALIERQAERFRLGTGIRWGITRQEADVVIGTCGLMWHPAARAGLGYDLAPAWWRQGIMTEALRAVLAFAFETLGLNRVEAMIMPGNEASVGLLRALGFEEEGTLRQYAYFKGRYQDLCCFSLLRAEHGR